VKGSRYLNCLAHCKVEQEPNEQVPVNPDEVMSPANKTPQPRARTNQRTSSASRQGDAYWLDGKDLLDEARSAPLDEAGRPGCVRSIRSRSPSSLVHSRLTWAANSPVWRRPSAPRCRVNPSCASPGPAGRLARGPLSRHSGVALRPTGGRGGPVGEDARPLAQPASPEPRAGTYL